MHKRPHGVDVRKMHLLKLFLYATIMKPYCNNEYYAMPAITVKNIPALLYSQLKQSAEAHHRSINSELIVCLEKVLTPQQIDKDQLLMSARAMRNKLTNLKVTEEDLTSAKVEGRE